MRAACVFSSRTPTTLFAAFDVLEGRVIGAFLEGAEPQDDVTVLVLRVLDA